MDMTTQTPQLFLQRLKSALPQSIQAGITQIQFYRWAPRVWADSRALSQELRVGNSRGLFVDCGSNKGQGVRFFSRFYKPELFDYVLIEPNPNCAETLKHCFTSLKLNGEVLTKAASTENGRMTLWGISDSDGDTSTGASLVEDHNDGYAAKAMHEKTGVDVETFSFCEKLAEWAADYDKIVVKLDVEGAEYAILDDLLETQSLGYIHTLYVEFHSRFREEPEHTRLSNKERQLVESFLGEPTRVRSWA